jgi:hypothetical protein
MDPTAADYFWLRHACTGIQPSDCCLERFAYCVRVAGGTWNDYAVAWLGCPTLCHINPVFESSCAESITVHNLLQPDISPKKAKGATQDDMAPE